MIYISETTAAALAEHFAKRRRPNSPYVFTGRHGLLDLRSIHDRLRRYGEQCDVPVSPHRLRHTFGRPFGRLVNISLDMARCQERVSSPWRFRGPSTLGWSASREHERVVRGRPTPKKRTFRMDGKG
jgi:hypothetical protein